ASSKRPALSSHPLLGALTSQASQRILRIARATESLDMERSPLGVTNTECSVETTGLPRHPRLEEPTAPVGDHLPGSRAGRAPDPSHLQKNPVRPGRHGLGGGNISDLHHDAERIAESRADNAKRI